MNSLRKTNFCLKIRYCNEIKKKRIQKYDSHSLLILSDVVVLIGRT